MKNYLLLFILTFAFASCSECCQTAEAPSNGFTSTEGELVTMGSQESVDVFLTIDQAWQARDYDAIKSLVAEDAELVRENGEVLIGRQAFADMIEADYQESVVQNGEEWGWTINYAFSVKPTGTDKPRGEYVNARFTGTSGVYEEWYQIENGKLISWHQTKRELTKVED